MSYTWEYLQKNPKESKRLVGIAYNHLISIIKLGKKIHQEKQEEKEKKKVRLIRRGGGVKNKLSLEDQIILTLIYLRQGLTFQVLGLLFQVSESTANEIFNYWQRIFRDGLPASLLEQVSNEEENLEKILEILQEYELIVDSAEQARERPTDYETQKKYFSGKKQYHSFKNQIIVLPNGADIVDFIAGERGPCSDINLWRSCQKNFRLLQKFSGDKAYIGEEKINVPHKKPKKVELTEKQKGENKQLSSLRIFVEHTIRIIKIFRVAQERFRLKPEKYKSVIYTICGLVRLRIGALSLEIVENCDRIEEFAVIQRHLWSDFLVGKPANSS